MTRAVNSMRLPSAMAVAIIGAGAVVAYPLLAAVQILVWNPLAAVPGVGLDQIYAEWPRLANPWVPGWSSLPGSGAPGGRSRCWSACGGDPTGGPVVGILFLVLLALGAPAHFWANFGPAVALADTNFVSGGDH